MTNYYMSSRVDYLTEAKAKELVDTSTFVVARSFTGDEGDWYIVRLALHPVQPGQVPFQLTAEEHAAMNARC